MGLLSTMARVGAVAVCLACAMLLPGHALAKEYGHYDFKLILVPAVSPGTGGRLDIGYATPAALMSLINQLDITATGNVTVLYSGNAGNGIASSANSLSYPIAA